MNTDDLLRAWLPSKVTICEHHRALSRIRMTTSTDQDLDAVVRWGSDPVSGMGNGHPTVETLCRRAEHEPGAVVLVCSREASAAGHTDVVGYFILYRLSVRAVHKLLSGELQGGAGLAPDDFAASNDFAGLYLSMIWANSGAGAAASALAAWSARVVELSALSGGCLGPVFARAATPAGRRMLARYRFSAMDVSPVLVSHRPAP